MRENHLVLGGLPILIGILAILIGGLVWVLAFSAGGGWGHGGQPLPIDHQLLIGRWKNDTDHLLITGFDFAGDGTLKMTVKGMKQPVPGRYAWDADRTLSIEYQRADVRQAYQAAAKAYRDEVIKKAGDRTVAPFMLNTFQEELPAAEKFQVGMSDRPRLLILNNDQGFSQKFVPAD
jgi:hypothetical protein